MHMVISKNLKRGVGILSTLLIFSVCSFVLAEGPPSVKKVLKEAENLTLLQDRLSACNTIYKAMKKSSGASAKQLRERLFYFAKYFYTDKGFQNHLLGKELLAKDKFAEAAEKFAEADILEKGNTEVLHLLVLAQLWMKKPKLALETVERAIQTNPADEELLKDKLAVLAALEDWEKALELAQEMTKHGDNSGQTAYFKGLAQLKLGKTDDAKISLDQALNRDKKYAETYYWLSQLDAYAAKKESLLEKYKSLCKIKKVAGTERDVALCSHSSERPN